MRLAFTIFRYFPFGGLQRDMLAIAHEAKHRGHTVTIFCGDWQGEKPQGIDVILISVKKFWDVSGVKSFVDGFQQIYQRNNFDLLLGFNKMPGLDVYFAGDSCFAQKAYEERNGAYRFAPRSRLYLEYEQAVFGEDSKTKILSITDIEKRQFARFYSTPPERFFALPPGISRTQFECINPEAARAKVRNEFKIKPDASVILCLGSGFKTKGLDRSIAAFAQLEPQLLQGSVLLVVGADNPKRYISQAERLGVSSQVKFVGGRNDIANIFQAVDVLLHPAYRELAGNVILEAMLAGKPVITTDVCGFSHYVTDFDMGLVISAPYEIKMIAKAIETTIQVPAQTWIARSKQFLTTADVFSRQACAVELLECLAQENQQPLKWISNSPGQTIVLQDELVDAWSELDIFDHVQNLSGPIAREFPDRQTLRFELNGKGYYRKLHRGIGWREIVKNLFQLRLPVLGAKNEWQALNKLHALAIPSLEAVAYGEQKTNPAKKLSFIVTRELTNVAQLDEYFQQVKVAFREKTILLRQVAKISCAIHTAGINHRDFYLCHFMLDMDSLAQWQEGGNEPKIYIMDLHRAQLRYQVPMRWLIKDLSGLYFSSLHLGFTRNDYYRFMQAYWQLPLREIFSKKAGLLKSISARAVKTYKRDFGVLPQLPIEVVKGKLDGV